MLEEVAPSPKLQLYEKGPLPVAFGVKFIGIPEHTPVLLKLKSTVGSSFTVILAVWFYKYSKGKLIKRTHNISSVRDADGVVGWIRQSNRDNENILFLLNEEKEIIKIYGKVLWEK